MDVDQPLSDRDCRHRGLVFEPAIDRRTGFVTGSVMRPHFWAEARVLRWLQEQL